MRIAIVFNEEKESAVNFVENLKRNLRGQKVTIHPLKTLSSEEIAGSDVVITAGGDGTTLKTVFLVANSGQKSMPYFLSVNFGRKGFLSSCSPEDFESCFSDFLKGTARRVQRRLAMLNFEGKTKPVYFLNEASIIRHNDSQVVVVRLKSAGFQTDIRADGIIVATETGSTAYVYSAGGARLIGADDCLSVSFLAPEDKCGPFVFGRKSQPLYIHCQSEKASLSVDGSLYANKGPFYLSISVSDKTVNFLASNDKRDTNQKFQTR